MSVAPRQLVHRGVVTADALWIDVPAVGEAAARARVLALWSHGPTVRGDAHGWLVRLRRPWTGPTHAAPGLPLRAENGALLGLPLAPDEWPQPPPPAGAVVRASAGTLAVSPAHALPAIDPVEWLDTAPWTVAQVETLAAPPRPVADGRGPGAGALREAVGLVGDDVDEATRRAADIGAVLRGEDGAEGDALLPEARSGDGPAPWMLKTAAGLGALIGGLQRLLAPAAPADGDSSEPGPPGLLDRWSDAIEAWLARNALGERLAKLAGRRNAAYLRDLLEEFDQGNLEAALRRALPLDGEGGGLGRPSLLLRPPDRSSLQLSTGARAPSRSTVGLGTDLFDHLRALYRKAHAQLDAEGRVQEAAFVLADLLGDAKGAVAYLESKGELRLAAQLAEGRGLDAALAIRLWAAAGDIEAAIRVARLRGAWAEAVSRLEADHPALAMQLRLLWAAHLAASGDPAGALHALGTVEPAPGLREAWLTTARRQGGASWARAAAHELARHPAALSDWLPELEAVLDDDGPIGRTTRRRLAVAVLAREGLAIRAVAAALARRLVVDRSRAHGIPDTLIHRLADHAGDGALQADLPGTLPTCSRPDPLEHAWDPADRGTRRVFDAAWLDDGTMLVALGEGGVERREPGGRVVQRFDAPTRGLVLRGGAGRALGWISRGSHRLEVTHLDLDSGAATPLDPLPGGHGVPWFDGDVWVVRHDRRLQALDVNRAHAGGWRALWSLDLPDVGVLDLRSTPEALFALCAGRDGLELWRWSLPGFTLRDRIAVQGAATRSSRAGSLAMPLVDLVDGAVAVVGRNGPVLHTLTTHNGSETPIVVTDERIAVASQPDARPAQVCCWRVEPGGTPRVLATLVCPDADRHGLHVDLRLRHDGVLTIADRFGRVAVFDTEAATLLADLRV